MLAESCDQVKTLEEQHDSSSPHAPVLYVPDTTCQPDEVEQGVSEFEKEPGWTTVKPTGKYGESKGTEGEA